MNDGTGRVEIARSHSQFRVVWLVLSAFTGLMTTGTSLALPAVLGDALDAIVRGTSLDRAIQMAAALIAVAIAADLLGSYSSTAYTAAATAGLRHRLLDHILGVTPFHGMAPGDLVSRLSGQATEAARTGMTRVSLILSLLPPAGALVLLTLIDFRLSIAFVAGNLVVAAVLRSLHRNTTAAAVGYQKAQSAIAARLGEALDGARTIAAAGTLEREVRRVLRPLDELRTYGIRLWRALARSTAQAGVAAPLMLVTVLAAGGLLLMTGGLTPGELFAASRYAMIGVGLGGLTSVFSSLGRATAARKRLLEVTSIPPLDYGSTDLPEGDGTLEFQGVSVSGLGEVDLRLPGGSAVAVVGRSGSGKSVLAALSARLLDPDSGRVMLDGIPLRELSQPVLRSAVGIAFERPALVGLSVAEAIFPGTRREAAEVRAHDFIGRLPGGYDTPLADAPMSGGEAQRLGLARAWAATRLLVLDDATSSLDMITESQIPLFDKDSRTRLIVTHRVAVAAQAGAVVWLDEGRVRAYGPHDLLWTDPDYRAVFR